WNSADFYDLFGPTQVSRRGYSVGVSHQSALIFDEPKRLDLTIEGRVAGELDQLPQYQNIPVRVDRLISFNAELSYTFLRSSLGHVDDEKGRKASLSFESDYVNSSYFTRIHGTYDIGTA